MDAVKAIVFVDHVQDLYKNGRAKAFNTSSGVHILMNIEDSYTTDKIGREDWLCEMRSCYEYAIQVPKIMVFLWFPQRWGHVKILMNLKISAHNWAL